MTELNNRRKVYLKPSIYTIELGEDICDSQFKNASVLREKTTGQYENVDNFGVYDGEHQDPEGSDTPSTWWDNTDHWGGD